MKYRTTNAEQRKNNYIVIGFDYCEIYHVTHYLTANAYTVGTKGWRADFYNINRAFTISTGYDPLTYLFDKGDKPMFDYIRAEIKKLNQNLESYKYACQKSDDWTKTNTFVVSKLHKIYENAIKKYHTEQ